MLLVPSECSFVPMNCIFNPRLLMVPRVHSPLPLPCSFPVLDVLVSFHKERIARWGCIFSVWNQHFRTNAAPANEGLPSCHLAIAIRATAMSRV